MKFCTSCGNTLDDQASFCENCGAKVASSAPPPAADNAPPPPPYGQAAPPPPQYGQTAPPPSQYGQAAPPPPQYGQAAPPPPQYGQAAPPPPQYGQAAPPPPQYGQAAPPPPQYGQAAPPPPQYGQAAPPPPQYGQAAPPQNPYGQPPYGQAPYGRPQGGKTRSIPKPAFIAVIAIVVLVGGYFVFTNFIGGGVGAAVKGFSGEEKKAAEQAAGFINAVCDLDFDKMLNYLDPQMKTQVEMAMSMSGMTKKQLSQQLADELGADGATPKLEKIVSVEIEEDGEEAYVEALLSMGGEEEEISFWMSKIDGKWYVDM